MFISLSCSLPSLRTTFSVTDKKFTEPRPLSTVRISSSFIVFHRLSSPVILLSCSNFLPSTLSHTRTLSIVRCHTFNSLPVPGRHPPTRSFISPSSRMMSVRVFLLSSSFFFRPRAMPINVLCLLPAPLIILLSLFHCAAWPKCLFPDDYFVLSRACLRNLPSAFTHSIFSAMWISNVCNKTAQDLGNFSLSLPLHILAL